MRALLMGFMLFIFVFSHFLYQGFAEAATAKNDLAKAGISPQKVRKAKVKDRKLNQPADNTVRVIPGPGRTEANTSTHDQLLA